MKCSLCGADLIAGNNTCPSCGALNMAFNQAATPAPVQTNTSAMPSNQPAEQPSGVEVLAPSDAGVEVLETPQEVAKAETTEGEVIDASTSGFVDLDEGEAEAVQATEDMAAPSLDLNNNNTMLVNEEKDNE